MGLNHNRPMIARVAAFLLWALAAGSAVFWGLRLAAQPLPVPAQAVPASVQVGSASAVSRMLGSTAPSEAAAPAPPPASSRFRLVGVLAPVREGAGPGVALISVDGKPARAYAIGARVEGDLMLQAARQRQVALGPAGGQPAFTLEVPRLPPPQTGVLAAATNADDDDADEPAMSQESAIPPRPSAPPPGVVPPPAIAPRPAAPPAPVAPPPAVVQPPAAQPQAVPQQPVYPQQGRPIGGTPPGVQPGWVPPAAAPGARPPAATHSTD